MNASKIRGFLLQQPKPTTIRITCDGESEELKPSPRSYAKTAETIAALEPELIECLDAAGKILRAMRTDTSDSRRSEAAEIPDGIKADPQALMLTHLANLVHRAYEHSTEIAFGRLVELADRLNDRAEMIEQRLERSESLARRLRDEQVEEQFDRAEELIQNAGGTGDPLGNELLGAFLSGRAQRGGTNGTPQQQTQQRKPNGAKPNGGSA